MVGACDRARKYEISEIETVRHFKKTENVRTKRTANEKQNAR